MNSLDRRWLQVNVALQRSGRPGLKVARHVFREVLPIVDKSRRDGDVELFYFMRKPPDIRMRFYGADIAGSLGDLLTDCFVRLKHGGYVAWYSRSVYEPEARLFGGDASMQLIHRYFDLDTQLWHRYDLSSIEDSSTKTASPMQFCRLVVSDLFARAIGDRAEVWDTWCNLADVVGVSGECKPDPLNTASTVLNEDLQAVLQGYKSANAWLANGLDRVWASGQLEFGLRSILPFVALFHFNRFGLTPRAQANIAATMRTALDPHRGLKGAEG